MAKQDKGSSGDRCPAAEPLTVVFAEVDVFG